MSFAHWPKTACLPEDSLSDKVRKTEERAEGFEKLAGEMLVTIQINRARGSITSEDEEMFDDIVESWERKLGTLKTS